LHQGHDVALLPFPAGRLVMAAAAREAAVRIVTGDTKVVDCLSGEQLPRIC
jgi:hypothetical protein